MFSVDISSELGDREQKPHHASPQDDSGMMHKWSENRHPIKTTIILLALSRRVGFPRFCLCLFFLAEISVILVYHPGH